MDGSALRTGFPGYRPTRRPPCCCVEWVMAPDRYTYMLRLLKRNPERIRMDRLAEYMRLFADLLGLDNDPVFKGIKKASTGLKVAIPPDRRLYAALRLIESGANSESKPARLVRDLEGMLGIDGIAEAQLLDADSNVIRLLRGVAPANDKLDRLYQEGTVDGTVTGLVGADDTMHLHLRDQRSLDYRLVVRDEEMARGILHHFRHGTIRATIQGTWVRTEHGWIPEANKCTVKAFEPLDDTPVSKVFEELAALPGNGWAAVETPEERWKELRGIH